MSQQNGQNPFGLAQQHMSLLLRSNTTGSTASNDMAPTTMALMSSDSQELLLQQELRRASAVRLQLEKETQIAQAYQAGLEFACKISQQQRQQQALQQQQPQAQPQQPSNRIQLLDTVVESRKAVLKATTPYPSSVLPSSTSTRSNHRAIPVVSTTGSTFVSAPSIQPRTGRTTANTAATGFSSMSNLANAWTTAPAVRNGTTTITTTTTIPTTTSTALNGGRHDISNETSTLDRRGALEQWTATLRAESREARDVDRSSAERRLAVFPPDLPTTASRSTDLSNGHIKATSVPVAPARSTTSTAQPSTGATVIPAAPVRAPGFSREQTTIARAVPEGSKQSTTAVGKATPAVVRWADIARNIRLPDVPPGATNPLPPIHTTDPDHLVACVKYRIAELRRRTRRNNLEDHFLDLLFDWARRAGVELPEATEYIQLLVQVQKDRRMHQFRLDPNGPPSVGIQKTNIQPKMSSVTTNPSAVMAVTPRAVAPVPPPVPTHNPATIRTTRTPEQTTNPVSTAAIEKAKPPALALMELLKLGQPSSQSGIATSNTGALSASTSNGGFHMSLPPPVVNAAPAGSNSGRSPAPPPVVLASPEFLKASAMPVEASPEVKEPKFEILASNNSAPKATEATSNSVTPAIVDDSTEVVTSDSILAVNDADTEPSMQDSGVSPTEPMAERRDQTMPALEIDQRATSDVNLQIRISRREAEPSVEAQNADASISEIAAPQTTPPSPRKATPELCIPPRPKTPEDPYGVDLSIEVPNAVAIISEIAAPAPREATPELRTPTPALRPKTPEDPYGIVNMRTIRSIPLNKMWVEIPVTPPRPRPIPPRPRSPSPRRFNFCLPEKTYERFDRDCKSKVLSRTLIKRTNLRPCGWNGCDAELGSEWQLEQHVRKVHVPRAKPVKRHHTEVDAWVCNWDSCDRPYVTPEHLDQHLQAVHVQQGLVCPYWTCLHRDTVFPNIHVLEIHIARSPNHHKRENVVPLVDLSVEGPIPLDCHVPAVIQRDALLPVKVFRTIWPTDRIKRNAINKVQEFSFVDRESPRMRPGESPPPMDMPMPAPVLQEEESAADDDTIVVKSEPGTTPYTLRRTHQSDKPDLVKAKTGSKPIKREMELEVVIELSRPVIIGV